MRFLDRGEELRRLDGVLKAPGAFAVIWGRRRVGKTRLLIEWSRRHDGLYAAADRSVPAVQRRYLATAVARRFPGFDDVEYPDWRSFLLRLAAESDGSAWPGPFVLDELPYLIAADPTLTGVLQGWIDGAPGRPTVVVSGSSQRMMHGAVLDTGAPLYGRAREAFAVRPLKPGYLGELVPGADPRDLVALYALWGGMPRYWELAERFGRDIDRAVDTLVLDPAGPLHLEPDRLLMEEVPPATALRPLLDVIGAGAHRVSEIAGRLGRPAPSLPGPWPPSARWASCAGRRPSAAIPAPAAAASMPSTTRSCGCGSGSWPRTGPRWPKRPPRPGSSTGAATARASRPWRGRSCAAWPSRSCTEPTAPSPRSARGSRRNATGAATSRSTTWWRARWTAAGCSSARPSGDRDRRHRGPFGLPRTRRRCPASPAWRSSARRSLLEPPARRRAAADLHVVDGRAVFSALR